MSSLPQKLQSLDHKTSYSYVLRIPYFIQIRQQMITLSNHPSSLLLKLVQQPHHAYQGHIIAKCNQCTILLNSIKRSITLSSHGLRIQIHAQLLSEATHPMLPLLSFFIYHSSQNRLKHTTQQSINLTMQTQTQLQTQDEGRLDPQTEKKLQEIRQKLWSVHKLPLTQICSSLLELIPLNCLQSFIPLMRECLHASKSDPHLFKYLTLFDLLLNDCLFNKVLHCCLAQFYSEICAQLQKTKQWGELEQAKLVRKFWARRIHPNLYVELKYQTFRKTKVDVDYILSIESMERVKLYYLEVLRMPQHELLYFLPQAHNLALFTPTAHASHKAGSYKSSGQLSSESRKEMNCANAMGGLRAANDDPTVCLFTTPSQNNFDFAKRVRLPSEDTDTGDSPQRLRTIRQVDRRDYPLYRNAKLAQLGRNNTECMQPKGSHLLPCQPQLCKDGKVAKQLSKQQSKIRELGSPLQLLKRLKQMHGVECKECGMRFQIKQSLQTHTLEHITQKIQALNLKQAKKFKTNKKVKSPFQSAKEWRGYPFQQEPVCNIFHSTQTQKTQTFQCKLCGSEISQKFLGEEWVLVNAVKTVLLKPRQSKAEAYGKYCLMHRECVMALGDAWGVESKMVLLHK